MSSSLRAWAIRVLDYAEISFKRRLLERSYIIKHFIPGLELLDLEELLQGFLFFAVMRLAGASFDHRSCLPIDVAELMFSLISFQGYRDIESPAGRDGTANSGHDDDRDLVESNVCCRLRDEHEALIKAE